MLVDGAAVRAAAEPSTPPISLALRVPAAVFRLIYPLFPSSVPSSCFSRKTWCSVATARSGIMA